ncbi:Stress-induced-phosphoprotein 1 [Thelohanellus kitauei]|uniref:Stress-induced-phosphoprotein 1 n=1 Tax=Thelohanellus kitauei TaxID=669202 RepID=A0A0C2IBK8_THEKT|nr:Stress-induced-phosphoprotein 1 [Thelohanellus kitauei]
MRSHEQQAESYKLKGNDFIKQKDFEKAVENYTKAIQLCPDNYTYYSNRSAAYASMGKYEESLEDAQKTIDLNPSWGKGYSRLGAALEYLGRIEEAKDAYQKGLTKDPTNAQLKDALETLNSPKDAGQSSYGNIFEQLMKDPKMQQLFRDPKFMQKVGQMGNNPDALMKDPEFLNMFSNIMSQGCGSTPPNDQTSDFRSSGHRDQPKSQDQGSRFADDFREPADTEFQKPKAGTCYGDCRETCRKQKESNTASEADKEKELGNCAYKKRDFDCALEHYEKAKTLNPNTIVYDLNISAVLFEQGKYDQCIKVCQTAIDEGRSRVEPFKLIAKAFARIGNVYYKLEDYIRALEYYEKSLSEHRDPEIVKKAQGLKKMVADTEAKKYINPELAEEERQRGNTEFAAGRFDESIKHYTESIKGNPDDAKTYSNRAAAYTKLMEFSLCIQDCDKSISLDP